MIINTQTFWSYLVNESEVIVDKVKQLLTFKYYDFDLKKEQINCFYQTVSKIQGIETLRFPTGLIKYITNTLPILVEKKDRNFSNYNEGNLIETANQVKLINNKFEVRDYQLEAAEICLDRFSSLIHSGVGSGKTSIMSLLCKYLKYDKILISNGNNFILQQIYDRLTSFGITDISWNPSKEPDYYKRIVLLNTKSSDERLNNHDSKYISFLKEVNTWIIDECFSGDTEILTSSGWKAFKYLNGEELFANFHQDSRRITFTKGKLIKRFHENDMIKVINKRTKSYILVTPNHQQLYLDKKLNISKKDSFINIPFTKNNIFFTSGNSIGIKDNLNYFDILYIILFVFNIHHKKDNTIIIKDNLKRIYFNEVINKLNLSTNYIEKIKHNNKLEVWKVNFNSEFYLLSNHFDLNKFSGVGAKLFLDTLLYWNKTSILKVKKSEYNENNIDFITAMCSLCGYYTEEFIKNNDITLKIYPDKSMIPSNNYKKNIIKDYNDFVYCVEVPSHNIIVRNSGNNKFPLVCGNCQHIQALTWFEPILYMDTINLRHVIGFTGSPFRNYKFPYKDAQDFVTISILGEPAFVYEMKDTIQDGNIAQPYVYFINYPNKPATLPAKFKDNYFMQYRMNIIYNKARNRAGLEMLKYLNKNGIKTLVSYGNINGKVAHNMMKDLKVLGIDSIFICGNETLYEWVYNNKNKLVLEKRKGNTKDIKEALKNGYNIIFGSTVMDEGVDIEEFQAMVLFAAGKTPIAGIQRIGRASRKKQGENISFIIDFKDIGGYYVFQNQYEERKNLMIHSGIKIIDKVENFCKMIENLGFNNKNNKL